MYIIFTYKQNNHYSIFRSLLITKHSTWNSLAFSIRIRTIENVESFLNINKAIVTIDPRYY